MAMSKARRVEERIADALRSGRGRVLTLVPHRAGHDRGPRSDGHPAALPGHLAGQAGRLRQSPASRPSFDLIDAEFVRDVEPGEMVVIDASAASKARVLSSVHARTLVHLRVRLLRAARLHHRRDQRVRGRKNLGRALAREHPVRRGRRDPGAGLGRSRDHRLRRAERASPSRWVSCAATTSAAPSSSRSRASVTSASA